MDLIEVSLFYDVSRWIDHGVSEEIAFSAIDSDDLAMDAFSKHLVDF